MAVVAVGNSGALCQNRATAAGSSWSRLALSRAAKELTRKEEGRDPARRACFELKVCFFFHAFPCVSSCERACLCLGGVHPTASEQRLGVALL